MTDEKFDTLIPQAMTALVTAGVLFVVMHSAFANLAGAAPGHMAKAKPDVVYAKHAPAKAPVQFAAAGTHHG